MIIIKLNLSYHQSNEISKADTKFVDGEKPGSSPDGPF